MKPHFAPSRLAGGAHHHWHAPHTARWRRRALLGIGAVAGLVLAANFALMVPLLHHQEAASRLSDAGGGSADVAPEANFLDSFDMNRDGVLDQWEFQRIVAVRECIANV